MTDLPSDLAAFAQLLDDQPEPAWAAFNYCLALMMVEADKARLIETRLEPTTTLEPAPLPTDTPISPAVEAMSSLLTQI